ncbi:MAG: hypothetical protein RDU76_07320 [Candidatus Edwardsbacteria bacterium]|nr:hypothetical protein [Candidatus Edwardsbacteria bacterium]
MMDKKIIYIGALVTLLSAQAFGQRENPMNAVIRAYEHGYFQEVIAIAERSLEDTAGFTQEDIIYFRTYLAFSLVAMGQEPAAIERFKQILAVKPKLELNPEFVSPKIIEVFKRAQAEFFRAASNGDPRSNLLFEKGRPGKFQGLWRSSLWPGWGQSVRGDPRKGRILKWGAAGVAAGTGLAALGTYVSHQRYLDATDPGDIEAKYKTYNSWYKTRNFTVNLAVSFWVYNLADIIISK